MDTPDKTFLISVYDEHDNLHAEWEHEGTLAGAKALALWEVEHNSDLASYHVEEIVDESDE